ncbi:MAG: carboxylating nicotinate-nucleotide diphosphorylase [Thermoguttaceae bacterium]
MKKEFHQCRWDDLMQTDWQALMRLAIDEDLGRAGDLTTRSLVPLDAVGQASIMARQPGVAAGLSGVRTILAAVNQSLNWSPEKSDGQTIKQGERMGVIRGPAQGLFAAERLLLNYLGRLSGIATLTRKYVELVAGTGARIFDTRKTTPGWRRLEKYAVRCGGGWNHRGGLFDAVLIKDNHLAWGANSLGETSSYTPAEAVLRARRYITEHEAKNDPSAIIIEVEVDTIDQLEQVLPAAPDIILLDNMSVEQLREAVARRNKINPNVELEASGGVTLSSVRQIAETGIERISVGALTHSPAALDFGLDWI